MRTKDQLEVYYAELREMRQVCVEAKREPSTAERTRAREILDKIDAIENGVEAAHYFSPGPIAGRPDPQDMGGSRPRVSFGRTGNTGGFKNMGEFFSTLVNNPQDNRILRIRNEGQRVDTLSEGGAFIPEDFAATFLELLTQTSPILQRARVFPMRTATLKVPAVDDANHSVDRAGLVGVWAGEGTTLSPDTIKTRQLDLSPKKLTLICKATREFMSDAVNADSFIRDTMVKEAAWTLDGSFIRGTGAGMPLGMMSGSNLLTISKEPAQMSASIIWENVLALYKGLNPAAQTPIWLASPSTKAQIFNMFIGIGTAGINYWPSLREATPKGMELFGAPVYFSEHCNVLGAKGDILLAAPENYVVGMRQDVQVDVSPHVGFLTDEIYFRLTLRVDAQPACASTLTLRDGSTIVSDFVTLAVRA